MHASYKKEATNYAISDGKPVHAGKAALQTWKHGVLIKIVVN